MTLQNIRREILVLRPQSNPPDEFRQRWRPTLALRRKHCHGRDARPDRFARPDKVPSRESVLPEIFTGRAVRIAWEINFELLELPCRHARIDRSRGQDDRAVR